MFITTTQNVIQEITLNVRTDVLALVESVYAENALDLLKNQLSTLIKSNFP